MWKQAAAFTLGAFIGECALRHKDKLTFFVSESISSFPVWIEQLIAESTGKEGKGILPVEGEEPLSADMYNKDRVFVHIKVAGIRVILLHTLMNLEMQASRLLRFQ